MRGFGFSGFGFDTLDGAALPAVPPISYSAEAEALFARMSVQPDATRKGHADTLIAALKSAGVWAKLDCLYLLAAHDAQAARLNWKGALYDLSLVATPTFTTDRGYQGNGTSSYLDSGFNPSTAPSPLYGLNSASLGVWSRTDIVQAIEYDIGFVGPPHGTLNARSSNANAPRGSLNGSGLFNGGGTTTSLGHFVLSRTGATASQHYQNGATVGASNSNAVSALPNSNFLVCSGGQTNPSTRQLAAAHIGGGLTGGEVSSLHSALAAYMTEVGA